MKAPLPPKERSVQRAILKMLGESFPRVFVHHSPNGAQLAGGKASRYKQSGALKGDGMKVGFPDLILLWASGKGAFLEVKRPKMGKVSEVQADIHAKLEAVGWPVEVVTDVVDTYYLLRSLGAPWNGVSPAALEQRTAA